MFSCFTTLFVRGASAPPEAVYGQCFNEGCPCAVSAGSGRDGHGGCTLKAVIGHETLYKYVKCTMLPER